MAIKLGDTIQGTGDHDTQDWWKELNSMVGQKLGDWQTEDIAGSFQQAAGMDAGEGSTTPSYQRRFIDTPWGRVYDQALDVKERNRISGNEEGQLPYNPAGGTGFGIGRFENEHGSDSIKGAIDANGVFLGANMDRESNAEMNTWLAFMATVGIGGAGGFAGLGLSEAAQLALAAASVYQSTRSGDSAGSTSAGAGDGAAGDVKGPEAPPPPPILEYGAFVEDAAAANAARTRNKTNLNPASVSNLLVASGNLLLGS